MAAKDWQVWARRAGRCAGPLAHQVVAFLQQQQVHHEPAGGCRGKKAALLSLIPLQVWCALPWLAAQGVAQAGTTATGYGVRFGVDGGSCSARRPDTVLSNWEQRQLCWGR